MIRLASRLRLAWFQWLPCWALRVLLAVCIVTDALLSTLWAPFRALGAAWFEMIAGLLEGIAEAWTFWIPCRCVAWDDLKRSLPSRDGEEAEEGSSPDCAHCGGRGGIGLWTACGQIARKVKEGDR